MRKRRDMRTSGRPTASTVGQASVPARRGHGGPRHWLSPTAWRRTWVLLGWTATLVILVAGLRELDKRVRGPQPSIVCQLEWVDLPHWLSGAGGEQTLADITATAGLRPADDIQDRDLCVRIAAGLQASPWVAQLHRVSKRPDGTVRVQATHREPFAFVEAGGVAYRVDREGVRLPLPRTYYVDYIEDRFWNDWFRIVGVSGAVPDEGERWSGEDITAGLSLVQYLKDATIRGEVPFRSSLRAIDVSNFDLKRDSYGGRLRIRTVHPRGSVSWGLPPGEEYPIEPTARRKLENLRTLYAERGRLPDEVVDVRGPVVKIGVPRTG